MKPSNEMHAAIEWPRMDTVRRSFRIYKSIEIALLALCIVGFLLFLTA